MKRPDLSKSQLQAASLLVVLLLLLCWVSYYDRQKASAIPDFAGIADITILKTRFFSYLRPLAEQANENIMTLREQVLSMKSRLAEGDSLNRSQQKKLTALAEAYEVDLENPQPGQLVTELLHRIDSLPIDLVLVQAATESGWGRSRFAQQGNNFFGEWCYSPGCGLVPGSRAGDADHEVRRFDHPADSVASYLHTINTHPAYKSLRGLRYQLRQAGKDITGQILADTLIYYSERRQAYVDDIKTMLRQYHQLMDNEA